MEPSLQLPSKKQPTWGDGHALWIAFTVLWLGVAFWIFITGKSDAVPPGSFMSVLRSMKPNEIGDFLSGTFAPLAFIFLARAVYIQSRELKAQQSELEQTRDVFKEQKDLMAQQTAEAKRGADLFAKQNEILISQDISRIEGAKVEKLNELLRRLDVHLRLKIVGRENLPRSLFGDMHLPPGIDHVESLTRIVHGAMVQAATQERVDRGALYNEMSVSHLNGVREAFWLATWLMDQIMELAKELPIDVRSLVEGEIQIPHLAFLFRLVSNGPDQINDELWSVWLNGSSRPPWAIDDVEGRFPVYHRRWRPKNMTFHVST